MGKPVVREQGTNEEERDIDEPDEDDEIQIEIDLSDLIGGGESPLLEFKSTLRTNLHTGQADKQMGQSVLKTLAGFLNTDGGTLVIGVSDDSAPLGIKADNFDNEDKMNLHLVNIVNSRLGPRTMTLIQANFADFKDSRMLVVRCQRSSSPVYFKDGDKQQFYVRTGPATNELTGGEMVGYIKDRF